VGIGDNEVSLRYRFGELLGWGPAAKKERGVWSWSMWGEGVFHSTLSRRLIGLSFKRGGETTLVAFSIWKPNWRGRFPRKKIAIKKAKIMKYENLGPKRKSP